MQAIDGMISALREEAPHPALWQIDGAVIAGIGRRRERDLSRRSMVLAACVAGSIGLLVGAISGSPANAEPLLALPAAAPSLLLGA